FLQLFPLNIKPGEHMMISLDMAATKLGTERRRIYDIINVLESLQMAAKVGKNRYVWYGCQQLNYTLSQLKGLAERLGMREQLQMVQQKQKSKLVRVVADLNDTSELQVMQPSELNLQTCGLLNTPCNYAVPPQRFIGPPTEGRRRVSSDRHNISRHEDMVLPDGCTERSLGVMCQKFIMLFLISNEANIDEIHVISTILISEGCDKPPTEDVTLPCCQKAETEPDTRPGRFKTKVRRLYDIANVLTSLGLICKVPSCDSSLRKPAFKYTGPQVETITLTDEDVQLLHATRHSLLGSSPCLRPILSDPPEPRKRKQQGDCEKFGRSLSECWSVPTKRKDHQSNNDSLKNILYVAEMELERLKSQQLQTPPKSARKKLFARHNSEPCFTTTRKLVRVTDLNVPTTCQSAPDIPQTSNVVLRVEPVQPQISTVVKLPVVTQPAVMLAPPASAGVLYRFVKVGSVVQLLPMCNNSVK
ncbi:hypothetical protein L9F63_018494, partial [Diploptera punctata]